MALTTVSSLSEMYSGSVSSATNDAVIKPAGKTLNTDVSEVNLTKEGEDSGETSKDVEV